MCGIIVVGRTDPMPACSEFDARWQRALEHIAQRGPDGRGTWHSPTGRLDLAHTRLAINDLSDRARQPMMLDDGRLVLSFNGEIYNARSIRSQLESNGHRFRSTGDAEVLLRACDAWGVDKALNRIHGMFAFVLWNEREQQLDAAVDHVGMKPLYFSADPYRLIIASDADAIRLLAPEHRELDAVALGQVLTLGYCPAPRTVWRGISKLPPASRVRWRPGSTLAIRQWWSAPDHTMDQPIVIGQALGQFGDLWSQVIDEHLMSDVPVGLLLSGGLDSTAIACALADRHRKIDCITLSLDSADDEAETAAGTARLLGFRHTRVPIGTAEIGELLVAASACYDEPQGFGALLTAARVMPAARQVGKVMLSGDGGDELFGGYAWHRPAQSCGADADAGWVRDHLQRVFPRFSVRESSAILAPLGTKFEDDDVFSWAQSLDAPRLSDLRRRQRLDLLTFCAGSILPKVDRAAMHTGLEVRCPMLDRRLIQFALSLPELPGEENPHQSKPLLRNWLGGRLPEQLLRRPKQGFSLRLARPEAWLDQLDWLGNSSLVRDGVIAPDWERFVAPESPGRLGRVLSLCMLAAWYEPRRDINASEKQEPRRGSRGSRGIGMRQVVA